jgi:hypothetical protein
MIIIETRVELDDLAKLARYYLKRNKIIRSRSHLIRTALSEFTSIIDPSELSPTEALSILGELGITTNSRTKVSLLKELAKESLDSDPLDDIGSLTSTLNQGDIPNDGIE